MTATDTEVDRLIDQATPVEPHVPGDLVAQVTAGDLFDALRWAKHAVPARPPVPVFACVHLSAHAGGLRVQAFDYEVHATQDVAAVGARGAALVPWRFLRDAIATLPKRSEVHLHVDEDAYLVVAADGFTWRLATTSLSELPTAPAEAAALVASFTGERFAALGVLSRYACKDETLPILTGVMLDAAHEAFASNATLHAYATDRYRLAHTQIDGQIHATGWQVLVPARHLAVAAAAFRREQDVDLFLGEQGSRRGGKGFERVYVRAGGRSLSWLCLDGDYPKVLSLFPDRATTEVQLDRAALVTALRRAAVTISKGTPARLDITGTHDGRVDVDLSGGWDDTASGRGRLEGIRTRGVADLAVAYNPGFLADALASFTSNSVRLSLTEPTKPVILTAATEWANDDHTIGQAPTDPLRVLLMPVRLAG